MNDILDIISKKIKYDEVKSSELKELSLTTLITFIEIDSDMTFVHLKDGYIGQEKKIVIFENKDYEKVVILYGNFESIKLRSYIVNIIYSKKGWIFIRNYDEKCVDIKISDLNKYSRSSLKILMCTIDKECTLNLNSNFRHTVFIKEANYEVTLIMDKKKFILKEGVYINFNAEH